MARKNNDIDAMLSKANKKGKGKATEPIPSSSGSAAPAMTSRGNQRRGPNRNSEINQHGEEVAAWKDIKDQLHGVVDMFNQSSANTMAMYEQDKVCAAKKKAKSKCTIANTRLVQWFVSSGVIPC